MMSAQNHEIEKVEFAKIGNVIAKELAGTLHNITLELHENGVSDDDIANVTQLGIADLLITNLQFISVHHSISFRDLLDRNIEILQTCLACLNKRDDLPAKSTDNS